MAREMRDSCQRCSTVLAWESDAAICSHECTFCQACTEAPWQQCPNCAGTLETQATRVVRA